MDRVKFTATLVLTSLLLAACGKNTKSSSPQVRVQNEEVKEELTPGQYRFVFTPLNADTAKRAAGGVGSIEITDEELNVQLKMIQTPVHTTHQQLLLKGSECPEMKSDLNGDGILDLSEAQVFAGEVDFLLNGENKEFPRSDGAGFYAYYRTITPTEVPSSLTGRVVLITGVPSDETLPIACGRLVRIHEED